jgi:dynein heavy chain
MDYKGLGNIFKGVASSGAWVCFDEFNRLVPEVLSVCTVQYKAVCDGIAASAVRIRVEGDEIRLDRTCGAFITMNPGYLGRSELPEGLKALFRPMTVMVPDLILICENMLMAEGFVTAKALASKFFCLYSLLKALLSPQLHYDWGLRAIKSVLVVAGSFKRAEPNLPEDALLMRALRDFNMPKIAKEDEVVFFGLLSDLFPGIDPPRRRDERLESYVRTACDQLGNHPDETFCLKVIQLEELLAIRHCVFIMGPAGAGKSQCWRTLKEARDLRDPSTITKVVDLNPKAVKTEELYGYISMATREWKDGLLSSIMRSLSSIPDEKPKWILLDGDLDAHWIESMNSVMDDNKMLTLASNERIPLHAHMRMIFEIRDLKHATPATVSRAGILYISTDRGTQRQSIVSSWIKRLACNRALADAFRQLFLKYVDESLNWLNINVKPIVPIDDINRVQTLINMLDTYHLGSEPQSLSNMRSIESMFVYCSVWAFGSTLCTLDDGHDYRKLFSDWWRETFRDIKFPSRDTVFDYWLDPDTMTFEPWTKSPYFYSVNYDSRITLMNQVTVPTPELCSISFWLNALVKREKALMLVGPAGTGKTQLVKGLLNNLKPATYRNATINFNYYTTASVLANTMSVSLEKKTGSNYGPPGNTKLIYFIDDLNLPELDPYNTQSAIAHLRQHIEYGHCYDLNKLTIKNISNTQIVACMNPSAGSFVIDPRLQRWFATFSVGIPDSTSLLTIYQTFLDGHLSSFSDDVKSISNNIIKAALGLHNLVSSNFKKTAVNFHYEFNLRHVSNVFEGLLVSQPERYSSVEKVILLWLHESERVYGDRLVTSEDLSKYHSLVQVHCKKLFPSFPIAKYYAKENPEPLMFCNFVEGVGSSAYDRVTNLTLISSVLEEALCEYNSSHATLDLVLFEDAIKHVARIVRVLRRPSGHVLLIGVGGSGKQSLSRLAAFLCGYTLMQITIGGTYSLNDFKEDLKIMYNRAGVKGEGVVFLLTDSQITNERFLVYINELLASGYIPDLFSSEDVDSIVSAVSSRVKSLGIVPDKENCWEFFTKEAKKNLHVCLCFSPVGDSFRNRAMRFPAVVNCTVIDIFHPWPREALYSVGRKFLADVDLGNSEQRDVIERFLPYCFDRVNKVSSDFRIKERRYVYTTPKSYLEMIKLYRHLLEDKRKTASTAIQRLENGLLKLRLTCESVAKLEESLKAMVEDAANKKEEAERIAELVLKEKAVAEQESLKALIEQAEVAKITEEVTQKQRDTEEDLRKAEPAVEAAMQALDTLDQKDLTNCKGMLKPPPKLDEVFAATMCLLAGIMPSVVVQKNGKVKDTSWDAAKKQLMGNVKEYMSFLKEIKVHVDNGTINHNNFKEVRQYLDKDYFNVETMKTKNPAAAGLCSFVLNIVQYYDIVVTVEPKRKALLDANQQLEEATRKLEEVMRTVNELEGKLLKLTSDLEEANTKKLHAMESVTKGKQQLNLAQRLTAALGSENGRWEENVTFLQQTAKKLPGDVLLASAFISYLGPFTKQFRIHLMDQMFKPHLLTEFTRVTKDSGSIPMSNNSDLLKILSTDAEIAQWNADSLPSDPVSIENGAIVCNSSRWPLIIDPQLQGIRWIKTKESNRGRHLEIVRLGQRDLLRKLEVALENGHSFLIENIGESIDATIMPVIQRATIKRGHRHFIKIGDKECDFHPDFRLFLHTKLSNPHFPPEIQAETTLVNFTVTTEGLEDQLLNLVVEKERPDLAALNTELVQKQNGFIIKIKELEDHILSKLASAEGDITDDVALIESLESTKKVSDDIEVQSSLARQTQAVITLTSERYRPVANRGSLLFFMMNDLVKIHSYYVYNLESFQKVFLSSIGQAQPPDILDKDNVELSSDQVQSRCLLLKDIITRTVFNYVQRGVFVSDKLTVTTLLTLRILVNEGKMGYDDLDFFLNSRTSADPGNMGPLHDWLPQGTWARIKGLESITKFKGIGDQIQSESDEWQVWYDSENPESSRLPGDYERTLSQFERMILLRAMRPDRLLSSLTMFIANTLGKEFIIQKPFNIELTVNESSKNTPVFFVLFPGVDPTPWVEALGKKRGKTYENKLFINISMGQGQESKAESIIRKFSHDGGWVMLQNCHLMSSWVPQLERLLEIVCDNAHEDFRCFISAEPPPLPTLKNMPESLMQSCIKVANEAPSDIKSNLLRSWDSFSQDTIDQCRQPDQMKACLFSLCWFHAVVIGRKRFGQQGWSRKYSFNTGDLLICANVLKSYLDACKVVPWDDLRYIFGEIMYGGHITDAWDRRTCNAYLQAFQNDNLFQDLELGIGFKSPRPNAMTYSSYVKYIEEVMPPESPSLLGLHPNAEIGYLTASAENLLANITALDNGDANGNDEKGYGDSVRSIMSSLLEKLPKRFDMITLSAKAAQMLSGPSGPYIVVALQECSRMNLLLNEIERSLMELEKGLKGQLNISQEMEDLAQAIRINQWPGRNVFSKCSWERLAWPSQKSLLSQFSDMLLRIEQLVQWTENLIEPKSIWLPGLFNPSSYLTATQQVCARKSGLALDKMTMETHVTTFWDHSEITDYAHDGTYIHGLYIEGARWPKGDDAGEISLIEGTKCAGFLFDSKPKELTPLMPVRSVHFIFVADCCRHDFETLQTQIGYLCPSRSCTR